MGTVATITAQELTDLYTFFTNDPRFRRLLELCKDTTFAQKLADWNTFVNA